jgi:uncharacterized membrane protein
MQAGVTKLSDAKILGGIGSILMLLGFISAFISIVGLILLLIAVKFVSEATGDESIFKNMMYAVIIGIFGIALAIATFVVTFSSLSGFGFLGGGFPVGAGSFNPSDIGAFSGFIGGILVGLAVLWIAFIISALFARRSYDGMASKLGVKIFSTAGLLYLIGAALVIIFGIGLILIFIAVILTIVGFFSIQEQQVSPPPPSPGTLQPPAQ